MEAQKKRVLVVGLGSIGQRHARLLSERPDVHLMICDPVEQFRQETQAALHAPSEVFSDYTQALKHRPVAAVICTPNHLHVPMALAAIEAGVDLLVEKPIADNLADARRLSQAAAKAGRLLQVGYMLRYDTGLQQLKRFIDAGAVGEIVSGRTMIGTYVTLLNARSPYRNQLLNSLIMDYTHEIDFIRWLFGEIVQVQAASARLGRMELKPPPNIVQMILTIRGGALVQVHMDYVQFPQRRSLEIFGDRGTLTYDFMTGEIRHFGYQREHRWTNHDVSPATDRVDNLFRLEHNDFLTAGGAGRRPLVDAEDGVAAMCVAEAAIAAAAQQRAVEVTPN